MKKPYKSIIFLSICIIFAVIFTTFIFTKQVTETKKNATIKFLSNKNHKNILPPTNIPEETTNSSVYMSDILSPYYTDNFCKINPHEKIFGSIYSKGYSIRKNSLLDGNITVFKLQKKYSSITGLLAIADNRDGNATLSFFGDGILLSQITIVAKGKPKEISLNVSNINYLTLKLDTNPYGPPVCFMNALIK